MIDSFINFCLRRRLAVVASVLLITVLMGYAASGIAVKTIFRDQLPVGHPYVLVNDKFKQSFGGSNIVSIMVEVDKGDIFVLDVLKRIQKITTGLQLVDDVNSNQIISLATRKLKDIRAATEGIDSRPMMWPGLPQTEAEISLLRATVMSNPLVYGRYVSSDLKAALITADFYDNDIDYAKVFQQISGLVESASGPGVRIHVVGEPVLYGWVNNYLPETMSILALCVGVLVFLLFIVTRTWHGTALPFLAGVISSIWALGAARLLGYNLEPLVIVVGFLITARSISHSVQLATRFDDWIVTGVEPVVAARNAMGDLFRPGMLGVIADAGCIIVVVLTPIPLMVKIAVLGAIWVGTIAISAVVMTPLLLSFMTSDMQKHAHRLDVSPYLTRLLNGVATLVASRWNYVIVVCAAVALVASGLYSLRLKVGDANPGSPILWPQSEYNRADAAINERFSGSDRMFVVMAGKARDAIKSPAVMENMEHLQKFLEAQPEVGGTLSFADVLPQVKRLLREGNPRYQELGADAVENGELANVLLSSSDPGDVDRFADPQFTNGSLTIFFRDHQGETIRTAIARVKEFAAANPLTEGSYQLAGGLIGVLAAVNEVILAGQIEAIALGLLVVVVCCMVTYRSMVAGVFFMIPVILSNTLTFSYMTANDIGMNINTLPVVALGIGLGVDYTFYIVDGIREELKLHNDLGRAIRQSLLSAGRGVFVTAGALILGVILWTFSSLRFQAEMGLLMALWLMISAASALIVMPAMVHVFRPRFIVGVERAERERGTAQLIEA